MLPERAALYESWCVSPFFFASSSPPFLQLKRSIGRHLDNSRIYFCLPLSFGHHELLSHIFAVIGFATLRVEIHVQVCILFSMRQILSAYVFIRRCDSNLHPLGYRYGCCRLRHNGTLLHIFYVLRVMQYGVMSRQVSVTFYVY